MSAFTCILPHDNNTGAQECPRLYLRGTHRWMFDRPDWLMCIFKPLSGSIQKAANYLHEKHPSCLSPAATLWLSHRRFASARLSCWFSSTEERSSCERSSLSGREKDAGGCGSATQPASDFIFSHAWPVDWCATKGLNKGAHIHCMSITVGLCNSCTALALWLHYSFCFKYQEKNEISCNDVNTSLKYFNCSSIQTAAFSCWRRPASSWVLQIIS